jgi:hypothetical protein
VQEEFKRTFSSGKGKQTVKPPRNDKKIMKTIAKAPRMGTRNLAFQKPKSDSTKKAPVKPKKVVAGKRNRYSLDFYFKRTCYRTMLAFYKDCLKPHLKECRRVKEQTHVLRVIGEKFCQEYQPGLITALDTKAK